MSLGGAEWLGGAIMSESTEQGADSGCDESELLLQVGEAIRSLRYGQVTVIVHDGEVVQSDRLERRRLNRGRGGNASSRRE